MWLSEKFKILSVQIYQVLQHGLLKGGSRSTSEKMLTLITTYQTKFCSDFELQFK